MSDQIICSVELSGAINLRQIAETAELLRQALAASPEVVISTNTLESIDIAGLQLLVAAWKSAQATGKSLRLQSSANPVLCEALTQSGFIDAQHRPVTPEADLWAPVINPSATEAA